MTRTRLIVNADDFGLTRGVNRAICMAHREGLVTATTVLTNQPWFPEVEMLPQDCPDLDIGLHVNLTLGAPLCDPSTVRSLVDRQGRFISHRNLVGRALTGRVRAEELRREVSAQAARLKEGGIDPTHWDSHESAAFWPGLIGPVAAAARSAGIRRCRSARVWIGSARPRRARVRWTAGRPRRPLTQSVRLAARRFLSKRFLSPDWRTSPNLVDSTDQSYRGRWKETFRLLPPGVVEVVSHPAFVDDSLRAVSPGLSDERAIDFEVLRDGDLLRLLTGTTVELIGFSALAA